jgi:hypothetical protein
VAVSSAMRAQGLNWLDLFHEVLAGRPERVAVLDRLLVMDLATLHLDLAAAERGYYVG